jgi:hypothetical protein
MADIFISYASVDLPTARRLADALEACGWSVWWDRRSLRGGEHFDRVIEEAICSARVVIVVWSKASVESGWVRDEATLALEEKKLVPLRIDMARLPMRFTNIHTIDFSSWTGETEAEPFERLVKDLGHYLGPPNSSNRSEHLAPPTEPDSQAVDSVGNDQQPAAAVPVAEHSRASPYSDSLHASIVTEPSASTAGPTSMAGYKRVGKYFAAVVATGAVLSVLVVLGGGQQEPSTKPSTGAPVPKPPASPEDAASQINNHVWTGIWQTTWGQLNLQQSMNQVTGTYRYYVQQNQIYRNGRIDATLVSNNQVRGHWYEMMADDNEVQLSGDFLWALEPDGKRFFGRWGHGIGNPMPGNWDGTRVKD